MSHLESSTIYRLRNGAKEHLVNRGMWVTQFETLPLFDGITGVILHEYNDVFYPHVIFKPFCSDNELYIGISHDFIEVA